MENFKHINLEYLKEISDGSTDLVRDLINMFISQVPTFSEQLDNFYQSGDYISLGKLAHKIKSSVAMMGISELTADMKILENIAKEGKSVDNCPIYISKFKNISGEAIIELNNILINLK
ncbi:MAG: Hpt domain-containing protein [Bacteroidales bacterium]|nr:Hpt domain-containing protein [Bacteroidales bacterium]